MKTNRIVRTAGAIAVSAGLLFGVGASAANAAGPILKDKVGPAIELPEREFPGKFEPKVPPVLEIPDKLPPIDPKLPPVDPKPEPMPEPKPEPKPEPETPETPEPGSPEWCEYHDPSGHYDHPDWNKYCHKDKHEKHVYYKEYRYAAPVVTVSPNFTG